MKKRFKIKNIKAKKNYSKISLTLDTKKDLLKIREILKISNKIDRSFVEYISILKKFKMNKKINVGIIGLGVGFKHLSNLIKNKNINKIFVYDKTKYKSFEAKKKI